MNTKNSLIAAAALVIVLGGYAVQSRKQVSMPIAPIVENTEGARTATGTALLLSASSAPAQIVQKSPSAVPASADPWAVFQKTLGYAQSHSIEKFNTSTYKQFNECLNPEKKKECDAILDSFAAALAGLKKSDFTNRWEDAKQVILATKVAKDPADGIFTQSFIFFIRDGGALTLLNAYSGKWWKEEREAQDSDKDGLTDEEELCHTAKVFNTECEKSDPNKRDTDGDGWWDSVQILMTKRQK